ncbi:MAG: permease [Thermoanaerobaculum sp.]|nr:permease [Thermoanaerobaculum sp.]MDW7967037.1 permease [Thermoanaerobaculum sp.]
MQRALPEGFFLLKEYARQHVILCLVPAFFIAGAIAVFVNRSAVLRLLGGGANPWVAYGVAAVSGSVLAFCSCTVLPIFAGIYRRGAGLGPAVAFLYSGPAINVLAVLLSARVLGLELGLARAVGAVVFAVILGKAMALLFRREEAGRQEEGVDSAFREELAQGRKGWQDVSLLAVLVAVLVLANLSQPPLPARLWSLVDHWRWHLVAALALILALQVRSWYSAQERRLWLETSGSFATQIFPLLLAGVLVSGWLLGRPGLDAGLVPASWVAAAVGGNSPMANFTAAAVGALMYFANLTEVPIGQTLVGAGMGKGPALALLLAGPAVSLPNLLVLASFFGWRKTVSYASLVVVAATLTGWGFGWFSL